VSNPASASSRSDLTDIPTGNIIFATMPHIGVELQRLRRLRGLTQVELARRTGLTQGYIAKIESAKYAPDPALSVVLKLARALGVSIGELVTDKPTTRKKQR
jgi:transcriptional regulator with XRE-family HTH domain